MRRLKNWMIRCLSLCHFAWGTILLLLAAWITFSAFRVLPYMSSGSLLSNLPTAITWALTHGGPFWVLGIWMLVLGWRAWEGNAKLRRGLIVTHGFLLAPGLFAVIIGFYGMRHALGGGLLSPIAAVPMLIGAPVLMLALFSIWTALTAIEKQDIT